MKWPEIAFVVCGAALSACAGGAPAHDMAADVAAVGKVRDAYMADLKPAMYASRTLPTAATSAAMSWAGAPPAHALSAAPQTTNAISGHFIGVVSEGKCSLPDYAAINTPHRR